MKTVLDTLEGLDEALKGEYTQGDDGKFHLKLEGNVAGMVAAEEVVKLRDSVTSFRPNNIDLKQKIEDAEARLAKYNGIDLVEVERLRRQADELKARMGADTPEAIQRLVNQQTEALQKRIDKLEQDKAEAEAKVRRGKIESLLNDAASKAGVHESAIGDFRTRGLEIFSVGDDGKVIATRDGVQLFSKKSHNVDPLTVDAWAGELQVEAPHLFKDSKGAGASGNAGASTTTGGKRIISNDPLTVGENLEGIAKGEVHVASD